MVIGTCSVSVVTGYGLNVQHFHKNEECNVTEELEPIDTNMQYDFDYQVSMKCGVIVSCNLVVVVFKDTALVVNPVFQLHPEAILIFPRMCGSVK